jgi:hypothetical protein
MSVITDNIEKLYNNYITINKILDANNIIISAITSTSDEFTKNNLNGCISDLRRVERYLVVNVGEILTHEEIDALNEKFYLASGVEIKKFQILCCVLDDGLRGPRTNEKWASFMRFLKAVKDFHDINVIDRDKYYIGKSSGFDKFCESIELKGFPEIPKIYEI